MATLMVTIMATIVEHSIKHSKSSFVFERIAQDAMCSR